MAKVTIPTINSGFASTSALNNAFDTIETEFNSKVLYRNPPAGEPNQLEADIDANDNTLYNVRDAVDIDEVVTLGQMQRYIQASSSGLIATHHEQQTAIEDQTLFTFTGLTYIPNVNNLAVFVNGLRQRVSVNYTETSSSSITFTSQLNVGDVVDVYTNEAVTSTTLPADAVSYTPAGTGAVATNVQSKLREMVSVKDFGAHSIDEPGYENFDSTAAIQAALNVGGNVFFPAGVYLVKDSTDTNGAPVLQVQDNSVLFGEGTASVLKLGAHTTIKHNIFDVQNKENVTIKYLKLDGNKHQQTGVWSGGTMPDEFSHAIRIVDGSRNVLVDNCLIVDAKGDGVYIGYEFVPAALTREVQVLNCTLTGNARQAVALVSGFNISVNYNKIDGVIDAELDSGTNKLGNIKIIGNTGIYANADVAISRSTLYISIFNPTSGATYRLSNIVVSENDCYFLQIQGANNVVVSNNNIVASLTYDYVLYTAVLFCWGNETIAIVGNAINTDGGTNLTKAFDNQGNERLVFSGNVVDGSLPLGSGAASKNGVTATTQNYSGNVVSSGLWWTDFQGPRDGYIKVIFKLEIENIGVATQPNIVATQVFGPNVSIAINMNIAATYLEIDQIGNNSQPLINLLPYGAVGTGANTGQTLFNKLITMELVNYGVAGVTRFGFRFQNDPTAAWNRYTYSDTTESCTVFLEAYI